MTLPLVLPLLQQAADTAGAYGHFPGIGGRGATTVAGCGRGAGRPVALNVGAVPCRRRRKTPIAIS